MINFFNKLYSSIRNKNPFLTKIGFYSLIRFSVRNIANFIIPIQLKLSSNNPQYKLNGQKLTEQRIIVTLTSFPKRINKLWIVIESILRQTQQPDKIILWLSSKQFSNLEILPSNLLRLQKRGLDIKIVENDLRSHKKYYYAVQQFPKDILITVDDDIIYPTDMIQQLLYAHKKYPQSVIARYGYKIKAKNNVIEPYSNWDPYYTNERPNVHAFFGSGGGTLFPVGSFPIITTDEKVFLKICPSADDIWLNALIRLQGMGVLMLQANEGAILPIINSNDITLSSKNLGEELNDTQLKDVRNYFTSIFDVDPFEAILSQNQH